MTRTERCLLCDEPLGVRPMHPAVESAHCPACWRIVVERLALGIDLWGHDWASVPALRSWQV